MPATKKAPGHKLPGGRNPPIIIVLYVTLLRIARSLTPNPSPEGRGERRASPDLSSGLEMINKEEVIGGDLNI